MNFVSMRFPEYGSNWRRPIAPRGIANPYRKIEEVERNEEIKNHR